MTGWSFFSESSKPLHSQTVQARDVKFWENVHLPTCVMCLVSCVVCHVSHITCHMSKVTCNMSHIKHFKLAGKWSAINGAYPVKFIICIIPHLSAFFCINLHSSVFICISVSICINMYSWELVCDHMPSYAIISHYIHLFLFVGIEFFFENC